MRDQTSRRPRRLAFFCSSLFAVGAACVGDNPSPSDGAASGTDAGDDAAAQTGITSSSGGSNNGGRDSSADGAGMTATDSGPDANTAVIPVSVAAGYGHVCALMSNQHVYCWGDNKKGQLGIATTTASSGIPVEVPGITTAAAVTAGYDHTCALLTDDSVVCFGNNALGQLGVPLEATGPVSATPRAVQGLSGAAYKVSAGTSHTCVVLKNLTAQCFGAPYPACMAGLAGLQAAGPNPTPRSVGASSFIDVQAGDTQTCFRDSPDGRLRCGGQNYWGEMGFAKDDGASCHAFGSTAGELSDEIALGQVHACKLSGGKVSCMGQTAEGAIGAPILTNPDGVGSPRAVSAWVSVKHVTAGFRHTCVHSAADTVECIGDNTWGQLGRSGVRETAPAAVDGISAVAQLTSGAFFSCAIVGPNSQVRCWGDNRTGQLGSGTVGGNSSIASTVAFP